MISQGIPSLLENHTAPLSSLNLVLSFLMASTIYPAAVSYNFDIPAPYSFGTAVSYSFGTAAPYNFSTASPYSFGTAATYNFNCGTGVPCNFGTVNLSL